MLELFAKGGPIMWPILLLSIVTVGVVVERLLFLAREARSRDHAAVLRVFQLVEHGRLEEAARIGSGSSDLIARVLGGGLEHRQTSLNDALLEGASAELDRYNRGLVVLDTAVTLGPLLGLLGTVTGMMKAFNIVGGSDLAGEAGHPDRRHLRVPHRGHLRPLGRHPGHHPAELPQRPVWRRPAAAWRRR